MAPRSRILSVRAPFTVSRAGRRRAAGAYGFTLMEMLLVVVILGVMMAIGMPQISHITARSNTSRAAELVRLDLERAFAIAARLRKPVQVIANSTTHVYQVVDQTGGTVRLSRTLAAPGEVGVETMIFYPATVTIQPNGVASDTIGVTLTSRGSTQKVSMSRVGFVRRTQ